MKRSLMIGFAAVTIAGFSPSARGSWLADITGINIGQCSVLIQNNTGRPLSFEISGNQSTWTKMTATTGLAVIFVHGLADITGINIGQCSVLIQNNTALAN